MGRDAILLDVVPAWFISVLLMTIPVTRRRGSRGLRVTSKVQLPFRLPRSLPLRTPGIAILAPGLIAVPAIMLLWQGGGAAWSRSDIVRLKILFNAFYAATVTPIVVLATLQMDRQLTGLSGTARM